MFWIISFFIFQANPAHAGESVRANVSPHVAPTISEGKKYISNGCSNDLKKQALFWAATDSAFAKSKLCSPKIKAFPSPNEDLFTVEISSDSPGSRPSVFVFGGKDMHPCDDAALRRPRINGVEYVQQYNGALDTLENAKRAQKDANLF